MNLEKTTSDYVFCKLAKLHKNLNSERDINMFAKCKSMSSMKSMGATHTKTAMSEYNSPMKFNPNNVSTLTILGTLI